MCWDVGGNVSSATQSTLVWEEVNWVGPSPPHIQHIITLAHIYEASDWNVLVMYINLQLQDTSRHWQVFLVHFWRLFHVINWKKWTLMVNRAIYKSTETSSILNKTCYTSYFSEIYSSVIFTTKLFPQNT